MEEFQHPLVVPQLHQGRDGVVTELAVGLLYDGAQVVRRYAVANERRDMLIDGLFQAAEMNTPAAGYIYATPVDKAAIYIPEDVLNQLKDA